MADIRKIIVIIVIAILFAIFVQTLANAIFTEPEYSAYCYRGYIETPVRQVDPALGCPNITYVDFQACHAAGGMVLTDYDAAGCVSNQTCSNCQLDYETAQDTFAFMVFLFSAVLGLLAIFLGVYLPQHRNTLHAWVGSGFMLGGLITIFTGTVRSFSTFENWAKPVVIGLELVLIIWLTYRYLGQKNGEREAAH